MGRRPKADAIRRAHQTAAVVVEHVELPVPAEIAENPLTRECWEWTVEGGHFTMQHVPLLTLYVMWWAVARQCVANTMRDGAVVTKCVTPSGERRDPDISTLQLATNAMRQLGAELGISPLAQQRMGLMRMATVKLATSVPEQVFKMLDAHREG